MFYVKSMASLAISGVFMVFVSSAALADGHYDDWWLCANQCGEEDAGCVDACTDDFNETDSAPYPAGLCLSVLSETGLFQSFSRDEGPRAPGLKMARGTTVRKACKETPNKLKIKCAKGTVSVLYDMPVYDEDGLFVVCYKKVPFCIPKNLEPEG